MRLFTLIVFAIFIFSGFVQIKSCYPVNIKNDTIFSFPNFSDGDTIYTCSGIFSDSGRDTTVSYSAEENYSVTICSSDEDNPLISVEFSFFDLGPGDFLSIYDGVNKTAPKLYEASATELAYKKIWASDSCLHFHFISSPSEHGLGWWAEINCTDMCNLLAADIKLNDRELLKLCPAAGLSKLTAAAYYKAENIEFTPAQFLYEWIYDKQTISNSSTLDFEFFDTGAYPFQIKITDTENNCENNFFATILVGTKPNFKGTYADPDTICAENFTNLFGLVNMITWEGFPTSVIETKAIPDGVGESYEESIAFEVFNLNDTILTKNDFGQICLIIDHVDQSQLRFELTAPNDTKVILKDYGGISVNLGEPVVWDMVTPGTGYEYCFSPAPEYGEMHETTPLTHNYTDNAGNTYRNTAYLPSGTYTSHESLEYFVGSPLNGKWTLTVTDNTFGENGYMTGFRLLFSERFYPDSLIFTPEIVSETWYDNGQRIENNPTFISKSEEGEYEFKFEIEDNFGCIYDTIISIWVDPLPDAEIEAEHEILEIQYCEGDSTILSIKPADNNFIHWTYQWIFNNEPLPDRIFDTIIAKKPGSYAIDIIDTITGCMNSFAYELSEDNCEIRIPNVFTPNNDGVNDFFEIEGLEEFKNANIIIYNRWGNKVFEHNNYYGNWWDGQGAPDGVYYYVISYRRQTYTGQIITRRAHGVVHIVR